MVINISDPPQQVKERPSYHDGTGHTKSFLKDCRKVIGDIPTYALKEHKTTRWGLKSCIPKSQERCRENGLHCNFVLTYLNKLSKDEAIVGRLLNMYIESEKATFKAFVEEESFKEYFSNFRENEYE
ncbi:hypothetical protein QYF36_007482 [Acer negundo]|nr:hypothetical protein QYF36_007482 [Acer negundo]